MGAGRMKGEKLRVGVAGLGYWGPNLVRVLMENPRADVRYCCDLDPAKLAKLSVRYPTIQLTREYQDLLKSDIDAVVLAVPVEAHYPLTCQALQAGKHVFVEKPLAASSEQALEMIRLATESTLLLMVGHTFEYSPPVTTIKKLVDQSILGKILYATSSRVNLGLFQRTIDVIWDLVPHDFSILFFWLGESPTRVRTIGRACMHPHLCDVAFLDLEFPSGVVGHVEVSWLAPTKLRRTTLVGTERMILYDDVEATEKVKIFDRGVSLKEPETFGEWQLTYRLGDIVIPCLDNKEPLALEMEDFISSILEQRSPRADGWNGYRVVAAIEAAQRSLRNGGVYEPVLLHPDALAKPVSSSSGR